MDEIVESISNIKKVEGRMELLNHSYPFHVIIDYCQHVNSYKRVFEFAKSVQKKGRIIGVFGAPGKRNFKKREEIGKLANEYLDQVILTAEDNRDEEVHAKSDCPPS